MWRWGRDALRSLARCDCTSAVDLRFAVYVGCYVVALLLSGCFLSFGTPPIPPPPRRFF